MNKVALRTTIIKHFNMDELQTLCFDLGIEFEDLQGSSKQAKVRELIAYCERNGQISELVEQILKLRPNLQGEHFNDDRPDTYAITDGIVPAPAVTRPVNLSFDTFTIGGWPSGWFNSVGFVDDVAATYRAQIVTRPEDRAGSCVMFWNSKARASEFGSLMQRCPASHLAGRVVRVEAEINTSEVKQWAGLWLRADGEVVPNLVFDNMSRRPIKGTTPWKTYTIEASLPRETAWLNYGIVLVGRGIVWVDNFSLKVWTGKGRWKDI